MFLRSLTLKGFKSFAEATTLEFEPGITVVVGPNGSGKSNIVDAIGWVLGAQAPSALRSQKMDDVIFAGTANRPALGRAEVALTIDNSAGLLPIEFIEVTISRTLFRTGDSEYAINGVACRLLDIQELLSDTGVGRQQHVLVSQGQIDAVLTARPEERRLIIEEAAGVLKYRRRKEKAERRLVAAEANLTRLQDLLREVRRQLRPLERQADAARRHGDLVAELTSLRRHLAGREIAALDARLSTQAARRSELAGDEQALKASLAQLDTAVSSSEARLAAIGGDDLGDTLGRFETLRERARGLAAVLAERRRAVERDRGESMDRAVVATLEAEAARLTDELTGADAEAVALAADADDLAAREAALVPPSGQRPGSRAAVARGELAALRAGVERGEDEVVRLSARLDTLDGAAARLADEMARLAVDLEGADEARPSLAEAAAAADAARVDAEAALGAAEDARHMADADHQRWGARADALAQALDDARARAGAERLAGLDGVLGTLLDLVEIDEHYEAAFEVAAEDAVAAVVVDCPAAGRRALEALRGGGTPGAVLPLGAARPRAAPPDAGQPLRRHVRARRGDVEALLDALVGGVVVVETWPEAVDLALTHLDTVVVTLDGDRFGTSGWRVGGPATGATGAALEEAQQHAARAGDVAAAADAALTAARAAAALAQERALIATQALDDHDTKVSAASDAREWVGADRRGVVSEAGALRAQLDELRQRGERDGARVAELVAALPEMEASDVRAAAVAAVRTDLEVRAAGIEQRRSFLRRRLAEVESRLSGDQMEREAATRHREAVDRRLVAIDRLAAAVASRLELLDEGAAGVRERRRRQSDDARAESERLDALRRQRAADERTLDEVRESARRAELEEAETRLRREAAVDTLRRDLDTEPADAVAAPCPPLGEGVTASGRARELERELRLIGPVNPLALEEFEALQERHQFLESQLDDVKNTRRELAKVIRAVDSEIIGVFAAAFGDVAENFERLFSTLFEGGRGRLKLTDPDDLLNTGIEIAARPSGKNVRTLSLLSGGERSLAALAFLFAVFRSRPSPFYVMDEVEAALDDVNLHRFLDLVREFREEAQLIVVSHQKRTMEAADCLYGVTMQAGGSSKVISERVTIPT